MAIFSARKYLYFRRKILFCGQPIIVDNFISRMNNSNIPFSKDIYNNLIKDFKYYQCNKKWNTFSFVWTSIRYICFENILYVYCWMKIKILVEFQIRNLLFSFIKSLNCDCNQINILYVYIACFKVKTYKFLLRKGDFLRKIIPINLYLKIFMRFLNY